ncbi:MAG: hypothetical protein AAF699_12950 [Pseudomonadota bacterium]
MLRPVVFFLYLWLPAASVNAYELWFANCEQRLAEANVQVDYGDIDIATAPLATVTEICPELVEIVADEEQMVLIAKANTNEWTLTDLRGLVDLQSEYSAQRVGPVLDLQTLRNVLEELPPITDKERSLWDALLLWINDKLGEGSAEVPDWLKDLSIPSAVVEWTLFVLAVMVVLLALSIIGLEMHRSRTRASSFGEDQHWPVDGVLQAAELDLASLSNLPIQKRPGAILTIVARSLQRSQLLPQAVSLTARDIDRALQSLTGSSQYSTLSSAAERATYGDWHPNEHDVAQLIDQGGRALDHLRALSKPH